MKCSKCGTELEGNALICPSCGQVVPYEGRLQEQYGETKLTKKEFLKLPAMKPCRSNINTCGILLYIFGVINIAYAIYMQALPADGVFLILLGLGIHLLRSRVCAVLCTVYGAFNLIYMIMETGKLRGWWILLVAIDAAVYTFRYHGAWNKYKKDGTLPVEKG